MSMWDLQVALDTRLYGNIIHNGRVVPVYDTVPSDNDFPYIKFGEDTSNNWSSKTNHGNDITHTLHVFSKQSFKREVKQIMKLIEDSLKVELELDGLKFQRVEFQEVISEENNTIQHGIMRIRAKIKE